MHGKQNKKITFISAYRVSAKTSSQQGSNTIHQQEYRALIQLGHPPSIDPREQFNKCIIEFIQHLQDNNHEVILALDANEPPNQPGGIIEQLRESCRLYDALTSRHPHSVTPSTYSRGHAQLDYILIPHHWLQEVLAATVLPLHHEMTFSDHRAIVIDINIHNTFDIRSYNTSLVPPKLRGVRLKSIKTLTEYTSKLSEYVAHHKIHERSKSLINKFKLDGPSQQLIRQTNELDKEYGEYMIAAEQHASKIAHRRPLWSPALHHIIHHIRY